MATNAEEDRNMSKMKELFEDITYFIGEVSHGLKHLEGGRERFVDLLMKHKIVSDHGGDAVLYNTDIEACDIIGMPGSKFLHELMNEFDYDGIDVFISVFEAILDVYEALEPIGMLADVDEVKDQAFRTDFASLYADAVMGME